MASAIEPAADGLVSGQTMVPQVTTRAQDPPRSYELLARKVATIPYRIAVASAPPSGALVQLALAAARHLQASPISTSFFGRGDSDKSVACWRSFQSHSSS